MSNIPLNVNTVNWDITASKVLSRFNQNLTFDSSNSLISFQKNSTQFATFDTSFNFTNLPSCSAAPTSSTQLVNKNYVDTFNFPLNTQTVSYILVVGDNNNRIVMNSGSSTTITVNTGIFSANDTVYFVNKGAGTTTITQGAGVTINNASGLSLAQNQSGTLVADSASNFFFFANVGVGYGVATGGSSSTITVGGESYTLLTFTATTTTLTVSRAGLFDFLIVAGGGNGGYATGFSGVSYCGGGGGGGILLTQAYLSANATITVGAGAVGRIGIAGDPSSITSGGFTWAAAGGGQGAGQYTSSDRFPAYAGGCGGGGMGTGNANYAVNAVGKAIGGGIGFRGGNGVQVDNNAGGGGGGGGAVGSDGSGTVGGNGGIGYDASSFRGEVAGTTRYSGGGGGGGASGGTGGAGGGGNRGVAGSPNTGGGGGGGIINDGFPGGSGIVLVRFKN